MPALRLFKPGGGNERKESQTRRANSGWEPLDQSGIIGKILGKMTGKCKQTSKSQRGPSSSGKRENPLSHERLRRIRVLGAFLDARSFRSRFGGRAVAQVVQFLFQFVELPFQIGFALLGLLEQLLRHVELRYLCLEEVVDQLELGDPRFESVVNLQEAVVGLRGLEVSVVLR